MAAPSIATWLAANSGGSSVTSITLTKPSGVAVGDLLLLVAGHEYPAASSHGTISGWNKFFDEGDGTSDSHIAGYWRIADGTEAATQAVTHSGASQTFGWYIRITGAHATAPLDVTGTPELTASSTITAPSINTTVDDCLAFYALSFDGADGDPFGEPTGWTELDEEESGTGAGDGGGAIGYKTQSSAGATGDAVISASTNDGHVSIQWAFSPPAAGGGGSAHHIHLPLMGAG